MKKEGAVVLTPTPPSPLLVCGVSFLCGSVAEKGDKHAVGRLARHPRKRLPTARAKCVEVR